MNNNQINGQKNNKEAYCPNPIFNNGTVSIGEFKTIEDAMNFPMQEIWCINRTQDNKFNSYVSQGCRLLIICDWGKSIQDSQKFVVALISKSGKITYWDLNDLPINTRQYENSIDNDVLTAIYAVADELYRNNNQLNCNLNMNKKLIRLTESDLHRIVKESVNKILKEVAYQGNYPGMDNGYGRFEMNHPEGKYSLYFDKAQRDAHNYNAQQQGQTPNPYAGWSKRVNDGKGNWNDAEFNSEDMHMYNDDDAGATAANIRKYDPNGAYHWDMFRGRGDKYRQH